MHNIDVAQAFSTLSNEARLRCLHLAFRNPEVCVCEAVAALGISQPAVSKAMAALKALDLLETRRDATWTYYRMQPEAPEWLRDIVARTMAELEARQPYRVDQERFLALDMRTPAAARG